MSAPASTFPAVAGPALADTRLRRNLRTATTTMRTRRAAAAVELSDWERLREAGRGIKDRDVVGHDVYRRELERAVTEAGGTVHWARDAAEASRIVTELVLATGQNEVVKVRSAV